MKNTLDQHRVALFEQQMENTILKDLLASRGVAFQAELETRKAVMMQSRNGSFAQPSTGSRSGSYGQISSSALSSSGRSALSAIGRLPTTPDVSAIGGGFRGHSAAEAGISEQSIKQEPTAIPDMPGIFERDQ